VRTPEQVRDGLAANDSFLREVTVSGTTLYTSPERGARCALEAPASTR
jgi:hypothetical protein